MRRNPMWRNLGLAMAVLSLAACAGGGRHETPASGQNEVDELTIVTTTDFHAALSRAEGLAATIRGLRAKYADHMLYIDGGDLFQGSIEGNQSKGRSIVEFFNLVGLDSTAIGNHDLDFGPDIPGRVTVRGREDGMGNLKARVRNARFKWLSANLVKDHNWRCRPKAGNEISHCNALGQRTVFEPHAIFERAGRRVCVIGASTPLTPSIVRPQHIKGVRFDPLKPVVEAEAKFLRGQERCDFVILDAHAGVLCDNKTGNCKLEGDRAEILPLLKALPKGTVDAVVAGHTHLIAQDVINGTPVIETGIGATDVGVLHLSGTRGNVKFRFEKFVSVPETAEQPDVTAALKPFRDAADEVRRRPSGSTIEAFARDYNAENPTANLVADAMLAAGREVDGADFALVNAGGVRAGLPKGALTYGDVFNVLPFDNSLAIVDLRASELRELLEVAASNGHGTPGVSGLRIKRINAAPGLRGPWDRDLNGDGKREDWERNLILEITDDSGKPLDDTRRYKLATNDFLLAGGDHENVVYGVIPDSRKRIFEEVWIRDVLADFLRKHPSAAPRDFYSPDHPRIQNTAPNK